MNAATGTMFPDMGIKGKETPVSAAEAARLEAVARAGVIQKAEQAKAAALAEVEANADAEWKLAAMDAVRTVALKHSVFAADDVWAFLEKVYPNQDTHEHRAMGAVMRNAMSRRWCIPAGTYRKSGRLEQKRRPIPEYISLLSGE